VQRRFPRAGFRPELCQNRKNPLRFLSVDGLLLASASPDRRQRIPNLPEGVHHLAMLRCRVSLGAVLGIDLTFGALALGAGNGPGAGPCGHLLAARGIRALRSRRLRLALRSARSAAGGPGRAAIGAGQLASGTLPDLSRTRPVRSPARLLGKALGQHEAFFHVDAAQGFGKLIPDLQNPRLDLISISGHKVYAPKGIGALVTRRRRYERPPLTPLCFGGGQERGLRPGTLPVALIVALGKAAELATRDSAKRLRRCQDIKDRALQAFGKLGGIVSGDPQKAIPSTLNVAIPGLDSEAVMLALKDLIAISNGSACTSQNYTTSHVLTAMSLPEDQIKGALRLSWCHLTPDPPWEQVVQRIESLR